MKRKAGLLGPAFAGFCLLAVGSRPHPTLDCPVLLGTGGYSLPQPCHSERATRAEESVFYGGDVGIAPYNVT